MLEARTDIKKYIEDPLIKLQRNNVVLDFRKTINNPCVSILLVHNEYMEKLLESARIKDFFEHKNCILSEQKREADQEIEKDQ